MQSAYWSKEELSSFCLEMSLLLKAGMPVDVCFYILAEEEKDGNKKQKLTELYQQTNLGISIGNAMEKVQVFPPYLLKMVRLGLETGYLEKVFYGLSGYYEERRSVEQMLKEVVFFPVVLLIMMSVVVMILLIEVLPVFQDVFAQLGGTLSPLALFFLNFGMAIQKRKTLLFIIAVVLMIGILFILFHIRARNKWRCFWKRRLAETKIGRSFDAAHFASALLMGISGGLDTDRALEIAEEFCQSSIQDRIRLCRERTQMGIPLADAVAEQELLKPMYCRMLSVGIKTGSLDATLEEISRRSGEEAAEALRKNAAKVEPAVVIILCIIVGILLLSVMLPLAGIMNSL